MGLELDPLSPVRITEGLIEWKSSGFGVDLMVVETRCADHATSFYLQKLTLTLLISGGRTVGIVFLQTKSHGVWIVV
jgi:hypothetical protein